MLEKLKENKNNLFYISIIFIISRIFILTIALVSPNTLGNIVNIFDSEHYQSIAYNGYTKELLTAFFPIVPLIIKYFGIYGMILVSQLSSFGTLLIIDKLLENIKTKTKLFALAIFAFCPLTTFSIIPYTENLFFFLTILAFYLFVKRKIGFLLGIVIGLCVATRNSGSMLFFAIFIAMLYLWFKKEIKFINIVKTYIPATIISCLYPLYLQLNYGNWKIFMDCQNPYWGKVDSNILFLLKNQISIIFNPHHYDGANRTEIVILFYRINEILTIILGLCILALGIIIIRKYFKNKQNMDIANLIVCYMYVILSMFCFTLSIRNPMVDSPSTSFYRYFLALFPIYLAIGNLKEKYIKIIFLLTLGLTFFTALYFYTNVFFY